MFQAVYIGLIALIAAVTWYYLRFLAPYSKLPSCYTLIMYTIYWTLTGQSVKINFLPKMKEFCQKYDKEGMFVTWFGVPTVVIHKPEFVKKIFNDPAAIHKPKFYDMFKCFFRDTVFISNGEKWKKQKKILKRAFQTDNVKRKILITIKHSRSLVKNLSNLQSSPTNSILDILKDCTLRITLESYFGSSNCSIEKIALEDVKKIYAFTADRILKPWLYPDISLRIFPDARKCIAAFKEAYGVTGELLEAMEENMLKSNKNISDIKPELLGDMLIIERLKDPSITMDFLIRQMLFLIVSAFDTTAIICMWCLYCLGIHKEMQENIYLEMEEVNEIPDDAELRKMEYTECFIKEVLRIFPGASLIARLLTEEVQCGEYKIPEGSTLFIPLYVVNKNPDMFPDPERFDPERFRQTKDGNCERLFTAPFTEGLRPCPGKTDAMNQLKIFIYQIVRNFKVISLDRREDVELSWEIAIRPAKPLRMQFIPRDTKSEC